MGDQTGAHNVKTHTGAHTLKTGDLPWGARTLAQTLKTGVSQPYPPFRNGQELRASLYTGGTQTVARILKKKNVGTHLENRGGVRVTLSDPLPQQHVLRANVRMDNVLRPFAKVNPGKECRAFFQRWPTRDTECSSASGEVVTSLDETGS